MIDFLLGLALGAVLGFSLGLRQVSRYFGGRDPLQAIEDMTKDAEGEQPKEK